MSAEFKTLLTSFGAAKLAEIQATNEALNLRTIALGDGGGQSVQPSTSQTALVNETYRAQINTLTQDSNNDSYYIAELVVPADVGGWYVREIGLFDEDGNLFAVGNVPETYKPLLSSGSSRDQVFRMIVEIGNAANVTLKIDPSLVLATREYVENLLSVINTQNAWFKDIFIGSPIPYPLSTPPDGCLIMKGQTINKSVYPKLYQKYGATLTDLRGEIIRGWDNGRGVDAARTLLSAQYDAIQYHAHRVFAHDIMLFKTPGEDNTVMRLDMAQGADTSGSWIVAGDHGADRVGHAGAYSGRRANETRMRNVAFNYICIAG